MYVDIRHESRANITFHNMAKVSLRGNQNYLVKWYYNNEAYDKNYDPSIIFPKNELFGEMSLNGGTWGAYPMNEIGHWRVEFWQENRLTYTYTNILEKNNVLILFDNDGNDFGEFVKKIKEYSDDISNRFGCNTYVFFKNSELCDFTNHKGIPLRLNDDINSFKIIYNKTF